MAPSTGLRLQIAVQALNARGILVVASAGNDGLDTDAQSHVPSTLPVANVVGVAAVDQLTATGNAVGLPTLWSGSNYGSHTVMLAAPGVQVRHPPTVQQPAVSGLRCLHPLRGQPQSGVPGTSTHFGTCFKSGEDVC